MTSEATDDRRDWVARLPDYSAVLPPKNTSLTSRFSIFSLFRTAPSPESHLDPIDALALAVAPTNEELNTAVGGLQEYVAHVKRVHGGMSDNEKDEAQRNIVAAMLAIIGAICRSSATCAHEGDPDNEILLVRGGAYMDRILVSIFDLPALDSLSSSVSDTITREVLGAIFPPTVYTPHLAALMAQPRQLISKLRHAARSSHFKSFSSTTSEAGVPRTPAEEAEAYENPALAWMAWLDTFISRVQAIGYLKDFPKTKQRPSVGERKPVKGGSSDDMSERARQKAAVAGQNRVSRIVIETIVLQAEMSASMATARIEDVKQRAGVYELPPLSSAVSARDRSGTPDNDFDSKASATPAGGKSEKLDKVKRDSRKRRRALTVDSESEGEMTSDEGEFSKGLPVQSAIAVLIEPTGKTRHNVLPAHTGYTWETTAESKLVKALQKAAELVRAKRLEVLVGKVDREDWLDDGGVPLTAGMMPVTPIRVSGRGFGTKVGASTPTPQPRGVINPVQSGGPGKATDVAASAKQDDQDDDHHGRADEEDEEADEDDSDADEDDEDEEEEEEEDLSHPCPLRTLSRLHDQYTEQRIGIWDALPLVNSKGERRCSQVEYMRGAGGQIGLAWDELGKGLLKALDVDQLEAYGLERDKYEEWLDAARAKRAARGGGKGRKKGKMEE